MQAEGGQRSGERRVRKTPLFWPERRTGFDRRVPNDALSRFVHDTLRHLSRNDRLILALLVAVNIANFVDMGITFILLGAGAVEANLLMRALLEWSPAIAVVAKALIVLGVTVGVWIGRRYKAVLASGVAAGLAFALLMVYEIHLLIIFG